MASAVSGVSAMRSASAAMVTPAARMNAAALAERGSRSSAVQVGSASCAVRRRGFVGSGGGALGRLGVPWSRGWPCRWGHLGGCGVYRYYPAHLGHSSSHAASRSALLSLLIVSPSVGRASWVKAPRLAHRSTASRSSAASVGLCPPAACTEMRPTRGCRSSPSSDSGSMENCFAYLA